MKHHSTCIRTFKFQDGFFLALRADAFTTLDGADYQEIRGSSPENGHHFWDSSLDYRTGHCCFNMGHVSSQPQNMVMLLDFNFNTCCLLCCL